MLDASGRSQLTRSRRWIGWALTILGLATVPLVLGFVLGYYAADQEMRWLPTAVEAILIAIIAGCASLLIGQRLLRTLLQEGTGSKLRKRVIVVGALVAVALLARLGLYWWEKPAPLTQIPAEELLQTFSQDQAQLRGHLRGLSKTLFRLRQIQGLNRAERVLGATEEKTLHQLWRGLYDQVVAVDQIRLFYEDWYRFDPSRRQRAKHLRSFLLTFAAEASLYLTAEELHRLVKNKAARTFLNAPHAGGIQSGSFSRLRENLLGSGDAVRVASGRRYFEWLRDGLRGEAVSREHGFHALWRLTAGLVERIGKLPALAKTISTLRADFQPLKRSLQRTWFKGQKSVANWMGDVRVRRIGWYLITRAQQEALDQKLLPGDILLSRKNWYLSNVGLPGFWPHAILYLGDPRKLQRYFDDPAVARALGSPERPLPLARYLARRFPRRWARFLQGKKDPYRVIEAISEGVLLNTMAKASGDYLVALRPRLDKIDKARAVVRAFAQLGKPYDFDFDFATDHALVCTELVWRAYRADANGTGLTFTLSTIVGRKTLPAHEIARQVARTSRSKDAQLEFVAFLDAHEEKQRAFFSTEAEFLKTVTRSKWDLAQR